MVVAAMGTAAPQVFAQTNAPGSPAPGSFAPPPSVAAAPAPSSVAPAPVPGAIEAKPDANAGGLSVESTATSQAAPPAAGGAAAAAPVSNEDKPWMEQLLPFDGQAELGLVAGVLFPSSSLNLKAETSFHQTFATAPMLGVRGAYFPIRYLGGELEYVAGFSKTETDNKSATPWSMRAQVIAQYPGWRVTPFAVLGAGRIGVFSSGVGNDGDPLLLWGVGAKAALTRSLLVRLDLRDNMSQKFNASNGSQSHSFEMLLGVSLVLGRPEAAPVNVVMDSDGDGLVDRVDKCPMEPGVGADGCPIKDGDGDGVADADDKCPGVKGAPPDGCPTVKDSDGDGVRDDKDKCIEIKGEPPDGCPSDLDSDNDGIIDARDKCPTEAETKNGFEDADGCPDELPAQVKSFTGVIQGIEFDREKATIRPSSAQALDRSASVLAEFPSLRVLVIGHTDDTGGRDKNVKLSTERAEAVKAYLVSRGIEPSRIQTRGAGPDEPLDTNATAAGRQRNRRIEFKLVQGGD
jgi:outer membrane protein OmpA-like peptidoglycan-associated protein